MSDSYKAWKRKLSLYILKGGDDSEAKSTLDLSNLRVSFRVMQGLINQPETAQISIYNLSEDTESRILSKRDDGYVLTEGDHIVLLAGYEGNEAQIFAGEVVWKKSRRANETDTFLEIVAVKDYEALRYSVAIGSIPAGSNDEDEIGFISKALNGNKCSVAFSPDLQQRTRPRGKVFFTKSWNAALAFCRNHDLIFGGGKDGLVLVGEREGTTDETEIILNTKTGLVGMPELTPGGVAVRCLLNPRITIGRKVRINNKDVQYSGGYDTQYAYDVNKNLVVANHKLLSTDGLYRVRSRDFVGDTHGNDWYCEMFLESANEEDQKPLEVSNAI